MIQIQNLNCLGNRAPPAHHCQVFSYRVSVLLPRKMELRSTGGWLVSTVILNLVALGGGQATHTNDGGRLNLDWRTLGTPANKNHHYSQKRFLKR